jgi:hypothetical protein
MAIDPGSGNSGRVADVSNRNRVKAFAPDQI